MEEESLEGERLNLTPEERSGLLTSALKDSAQLDTVPLGSLLLLWCTTAQDGSVDELIVARRFPQAHSLTPRVLSGIEAIWLEHQHGSLEILEREYAETTIRRHLRQRAKELAAERLRSDEFSIQDWLTVDAVFESHELGPGHRGMWIHSHGMWQFGKPELEMFGLRSDQLDEAQAFICDFAYYMAKEDADVQSGHCALWDPWHIEFELRDDDRTRRHFDGPCLEAVPSAMEEGSRIADRTHRLRNIATFRHGVPPEIMDELLEAQTVMEVRPIFHTRKFDVGDPLAFVLMPFEAPWSSRVHKLLRGILGRSFEVKRADDLYGENVVEDVWTGINSAQLVVADVTGRNGNVLYELGIAHTVGKKCLLLTQDIEDIPFDLRHLRHIAYEDNADGFADLKKTLVKHVTEIKKDLSARAKA